MKKTIITIALILVAWQLFAQSKPNTGLIKGRVFGAEKKPLSGVSIKVKDAGPTVFTNTNGEFEVGIKAPLATLLFSFIGYKSQELQIDTKQNKDFLNVYLVPDITSLKEVVVSTGYQQLSQERVTGSFAKVDNTLLNRRVGTDILSRLEDVTSGLVFNKQASYNSQISIRGQSTLFANANPLIVIDNFPYDGDIGNINPNDVESITVLKDAAAAAIWGARAGNGVIVITTKKGGYNRPVNVSVNSSITIGKKPDLYYQPQMSSADFIGIEKKLFAEGFYEQTELSSSHQPLTPVVELLIAARDGQITTNEANKEIDRLKNLNVKDDLGTYFYRRSVNQQYSVNINGGTSNQQYYVSAGYDKNLDNLVRNGYDRMTLNASNTYSFLKQKLELSTGIYITQSKTQLNNGEGNSITMSDGVPVYPYAQLADAKGSPLTIIKDYRGDFVNSAQQAGLLNWQYSPLDELRLSDDNSITRDYRVNAGLKYKLFPQLSIDVLYQYDHSNTEERNLQSQESYYSRNLINRFTQLNAGGSLTRSIPLGGILDLNDQQYTGQNFRAQLNFSKTFKEKHQVAAIAGYEVKDLHTSGGSNRLYGYDDEHALSKATDFISIFPQYYDPEASAQIPFVQNQTDLTDRYISYYTNGSYTYDRRYTLSLSGRIDQSNLFGVKTNQKGVPLWSAGAAWNINQEKYYTSEWLPYLKLRVTYGYNGNVYKGISAYTTARYNGNNGSTQLPYAQVINPPNPELRWEKFQMVNLGIDFGFKGDRLSGSVDFFQKKGIDLIGVSLFAPSSGISTFRGNYAGTKGKGVDLTLNSKNIDGDFTWRTNLLFSYIQDKVTGYNVEPTGLPGVGVPVLNRPLYGIYSYTWAGLDPSTGDPQGYLNGKLSKDYTTILSTANINNSMYNGSARPTVFGSLRNTITWKNISLSANISYRFNYYFRKLSVNYTNVLNSRLDHGDFDLRWQKPGDEKFTSVPSLPESVNSSRDNFYAGSSVLVSKADNIRLQDVRISYDLPGNSVRNLPVKHLQFFAYANNLGVIWKADKGRIDPDYANAVYAPVRTIAAGIKADF